MTEYQLPEPYHFGLTSRHTWLSIKPGQYEKLKAIHRMSVHSHETLVEEVALAELRGREAMRQECLEVCERLSELWPDEGGDARGCLHEIKEIK